MKIHLINIDGKKSIHNNVKEDSTELKSTLSSKLGFPHVRVEELDHSQEFFKEQHTTSFSYVPRKNWTSFTASKNGLLNKILLFGKANLIDSPHYGLSLCLDLLEPITLTLVQNLVAGHCLEMKS